MLPQLITKAIIAGAWKPKEPIEDLVPSVCPNGKPPKIDLEWIHLQDTSGPLESWSDHAAGPLAKVSHRLDDWFNTDSNDNVRFSFYEFGDKPDACLHQPTTSSDCVCSRARFENYSFSDLSCGPNMDHPCDVWEHQLRDLKYGYNRARPSTFDPVLDLTANMPSLSTFDDRRAVRVVTIMTDGCARESGRSTDNAEDQARLWKNMEHRMSEFTAPGYSLFDNDGALIEPDCDHRDYPTIDEVAQKLQEAQAGLIVVYVGNSDYPCQNTVASTTLNMTVEDYWNVRVLDVMSRHGVPYLSDASVNEDTLYEDLIRNIIKVTGDGCEDEYSGQHDEKQSQMWIEELINIDEKNPQIGVEDLIRIEKQSRMWIEELSSIEKQSQMWIEELSSIEKNTQMGVAELISSEVNPQMWIEELISSEKKPQIISSEKKPQMWIEELISSEKKPQIISSEEKPQMGVESL